MLWEAAGKTRLKLQFGSLSYILLRFVAEMSSTQKRKDGVFESLRFVEKLRKDPFSWRISVDGRPNCRNKAAFSNFSRYLMQNTTATATRTWPNRRFYKQYNGCARALELFVHFFAVNVKWPFPSFLKTGPTKANFFVFLFGTESIRSIFSRGNF